MEVLQLQATTDSGASQALKRLFKILNQLPNQPKRRLAVLVDDVSAQPLRSTGDQEEHPKTIASLLQQNTHLAPKWCDNFAIYTLLFISSYM